jgi:hypothetical protein
MIRYIVTVVILCILSIYTSAVAGVSDFEDLGLAPNSFHNNSPFASAGAQFNNSFIDFGGGFTAWEGFAYSSITDNTTPGFGNQYSAIPGHGAGGSPTYGVGFVGFSTAPVITLPAGASPVSIDVTNTTYAYLSMRDGDAFAKKFGGASGNDLDFLLLTITGKDDSNTVVNHVDFPLADFTFADNTQDYLIHDWTTVNLGTLAGSRTLTFSLTSSDNGQFGMNTPAYFAIDDVTFAPEPAALPMLGLFLVHLARRRSFPSPSGRGPG